MTIVDNSRKITLDQISRVGSVIGEALKTEEEIFGNLEDLIADAFIRDYIYNKLKDNSLIIDSVEGLGKEAKAAFVPNLPEVNAVHSRVLLSTFYSYINSLHRTYDQAVKILEGKED